MRVTVLLDFVVDVAYVLDDRRTFMSNMHPILLFPRSIRLMWAKFAARLIQ